MLQAHRSQRAAVSAKLLSIARAVAGIVDREINEADAFLKTLAASAALARDDLADVDRNARAALAGDGRWFVVADANYQQVLNTLVPYGEPLPAVPEDPELKAAMSRGEMYASNLQDGPLARTLVVQVSRPVIRDGQLKYTLHLATQPDRLARSLDVQRYAPGSLISILDRKSRIVARSRDQETYMGQFASESMARLLSEREEDVRDTVTLDGVPALTSFSRAPVSKWSAIVAAPRAELLALSRHLLGLGLALSALLVIIAGTLAAWIVRGLARGVETLAADTKAFARGETIEFKPTGLAETDVAGAAMAKTAAHLRQTTALLETALAKEQAARAETEALSEAARGLTAELDLQTTVQKATDAATKLTGAKFGAFFYKLVNERQETYTLYTLSGAPREAFEKLGVLPNTELFAPTFHGEGVVRASDILADPRYGKKAPHHGMPPGHLPVRSYLAVPVQSRNGEVLGGMFFGHPEPGVFNERAERIAVGIAAQASIAVDNAKLYRGMQLAVDRLNFSLASLALGEWDWDAATDAIRISPRTAAIYGLNPNQNYTREEMRVALHPEDRDRAREAASEAARTGTDYTIEYRVNHPELGQRWVAANGRPIEDASGRLVSMMGVVQDITDRKQAEMVLRTQNEVLERHVTERTQKLRETIGELEAFSYSISHDMRAPLRSMHGYAELLGKEYGTQLDATALHYLRRISANAARLELLVRDVLAYSKVAKEEIDVQPVDLDSFVPSLVQQMPESNVPGVAIGVRQPLPRVIAHEAYLSQIFTNLVTNAVKFVGPGIQAQVEIAGVALPDGRVRITVRDNGIGIDPGDFERIFQIFGRVHPDTAFEGTGIGLAIVKKAVQRMGGEIGVESEIGRGTTFWFTLARA